MSNLDLLVTPSKEIILCGKTVVYEEMKCGETMKAVSLYQNAQTFLGKRVADIVVDNGLEPEGAATAALSDLKFARKYQDMLISTCLYILKRDFSFKNIRRHIKLFWLTRKWIWNNLTSQQLQKFISEILDPIIGTKTKKKIQALDEIMASQG